jgi:hypothetical protein
MKQLINWRELAALMPLLALNTMPAPCYAQTAPAGTSGDSVGSDTFNLPGNTDGNGMLGGENAKGSSKFGYYQMLMQAQIEKTLAKNRLLKSANFQTEFQIWVDKKGLVTRVQFVKPSGSPSIDKLFQGLLYMQLPPPLSDMPMPILVGFDEQSAQ